MRKLIITFVLLFTLLTPIVRADAVYVVYINYDVRTDECGYDWLTTTQVWSDGHTTTQTTFAIYNCRACFLLDLCAGE